MTKIIRKLTGWLKRFDKISNEELVSRLILNTASMALKKGEYVEFAAIRGTCGTIRLSGNSLPAFRYTVFEKKIMEFVEIRVEVSKPDRIHFKSQITSNTTPERHGEEIETTEAYKAPFMTLAGHLHNYFPFPMEGGKKQLEVVS